MPSNRLVWSSGGNPLLKLASLQLSGLVMSSPRLRDFACFPTPNGLEFTVDIQHRGIVLEISADDPQGGSD